MDKPTDYESVYRGSTPLRGTKELTLNRNFQKILPLIFSILIFLSVFIFEISRNPDNNRHSLQLSPKNYLYKEKYGESKTYNTADVSFETYVTNVRVNESGGASEPKIICNPKDNNKLAISANDFLIKENFGRIFVSDDAGVHWKQKEVPLSTRFKESIYSDPWIDYDSEGNLFFVAVQSDLLNIGREGICLTASSDNGNTWKTNFKFVDYNGKENIVIDRPKIYIDKYSPDRNAIYVTWVEVKGINSFIMFSKSADGGNTFSQPLIIDGNNVDLCSISGNSMGDLYLVYIEDANCIKIRRSKDEGNNWEDASPVYKFDPAGLIYEDQYLIKNLPGKGIRVNSEPAITFSKTNNLLITYSGAGENPDMSDVYFTSLSNALEFTKPVRVHSDKTSNDQFLPTITVDGSDNIYVLYQDSRNDEDNVFTETFVSVSTDGGLTFKDQKLSTKNFNPCLVAVDNYIGDYNSCIVSVDKLIGVWTDGRNNNLDLFAGMLDLKEFMKSMYH